MMERIRKRQTHDVIVSSLRKAVVFDEIDDDDIITQEGIARQLGVSRMPVREAIQMLEAEGYLTRESNRRIKVPVVSDCQMQMILGLLQGIEISLARHYCRTNISCQSLQNLFAASENSLDWQLSFHREYIRLSKVLFIDRYASILLDGYGMRAIADALKREKPLAPSAEAIFRALQSGIFAEIQQAWDAYYMLLEGGADNVTA